MKLLSQTLQQISGARNISAKPALMTHVVLGYPSLQASMDIVCAMADSGARIIELQIPFSDPMADGPTIMQANERALSLGITPKDCMRAMSRLSSKLQVPLLFMSYFNLIHAYGQKRPCSIRKFLSAASDAGAQGLIVPDVPIEEQGEGYWVLPREYGLVPIPLVSPLSSEKRLKKISAAAAAESFVYCVSTTGTTGARAELPAGLESYLKKVKKFFSQPLAVGFGLSNPQQVSSLSGSAEIAIVGSAMISLIERTSPSKRLAAVRKFTAELA